MATSHRAVRVATALLLAPLACSGIGCGSKAEQTAKADASLRSVPVTLARVEARDVERTVPMVGTLKGWEEVTVGSKRPGRVIRVLHDMGDRVKPGEPLVQLDTVDARLAVLQAETKYLAALVRLNLSRKDAESMLGKYGYDEKILRGDEVEKLISKIPAVVTMEVGVQKAEQNLTRQRALSARNAGTLQELQNMENDYLAAVAGRDNAILTARTVIADALASKVALEVAEQALIDMTIRAPVPASPPKGVDPAAITYAVSKRTVSEGQMLREGDAVYDLVIENPLRLWSNVPERFSGEIRLEQPVRFSVASRPDASFDGIVTRINPAVDPISRTFQVEAKVENPKGELHPGGFAKASILTRKDARAVVVPLESVVRFAGVTKIFTIEKRGERSLAHAVDVRTGQEGDGWVEVVGNVKPDQDVVTSGQTQLAEGTLVTVRTGKVEATEPTKSGEAPAASKPSR